MYRPLPDCLTIKQSLIHGLGLFATEYIPSGFDLGVAHVKVVEWLSFPQNHCRTPLGGFYNHSSKPNCKLIDSGLFKRLVAIKDIKKGEEITCEYTLYEIKDSNEIPSSN